MSANQKDLSKRKRVGIIGGNYPDSKSLQDAETMGKLIAERDYILVNGGMGGVMEASAKGAKSAGGFVIGILPGKSTDDGNSFSDMTIPTGLGYMRNPMVILNADVVVAIDGSYGTLSEIAYAKIYKKPIFGLNTWNIQGVISLPTPEQIIKQIDNIFK